MNNLDVKDMLVAGCRVRLAFHAMNHGRWNVEGRIRCGIKEQAEEHCFLTEDCDSHEAAEREALRRVADLLGHNMDWSTSRVKNAGE